MLTSTSPSLARRHQIRKFRGGLADEGGEPGLEAVVLGNHAAEEGGPEEEVRVGAPLL